MNKFDEFFSEPQNFTDETVVFHGNWSVDQCLEYILTEYGDANESDLKRGLARYGFAPEFVSEHEDLGSCWYTGASGKGSKEVWIYSWD